MHLKMKKLKPQEWASLVETQELHFQSLSREDALEKEMAAHSSILAWKIHGQRILAGYTVHGVTRVRQDLATKPPPPAA